MCMCSTRLQNVRQREPSVSVRKPYPFLDLPSQSPLFFHPFPACLANTEFSATMCVCVCSRFWLAGWNNFVFFLFPSEFGSRFRVEGKGPSTLSSLCLMQEATPLPLSDPARPAPLPSLSLHCYCEIPGYEYIQWPHARGKRDACERDRRGKGD